MTLLLLIPLWLWASSLAAETRPNILLIMIDDLGWTDLHCQGNARLSTPNIDRLAGQGMRFTDAYEAMIEALDTSVGRVLSALDELNLTRDTLVVLTSDNGAFGSVSDLTPLHEAKGHLSERGLRVPLLARWPSVISAGTVCGEPVIPDHRGGLPALILSQDDPPPDRAGNHRTIPC